MTLVCPDCFSQNGLRQRIIKLRPEYDEGRCEFHPSKKGVPVDAVAEVIDEVIRNNYYSSDLDQYGNPVDGSLEEFLFELTEAEDEGVVGALSASLIENDFVDHRSGAQPFYEEYNSYNQITEHYGVSHSQRWRAFCDKIVYEQRYFNFKAQKSLEKLFDGLHQLLDVDGSSAIYELNKNDGNIFRARIENDRDLQKTISNNLAKELGPPPKNLRSSGRMNSSGICTFYGGFDIETCVAELRPAVGETFIAAEFSFRRPIIVLDTTKFQQGPKSQDIFTKTYNKRLNLWCFMAHFMNEIAKPCLSNDEHLDYIPTQVVAEYLVHLHKFKFNKKEITIDAIIFKSAQNPSGKNIAIFGDAAEVFGADNFAYGSNEFGRYLGGYTSNPALDVVPSSVIVSKVESVRHGIQAEYIPNPDDDFDY